MKTKCIVLGETDNARQLKPIEVKQFLSSVGCLVNDSGTNLTCFRFIELISLNYNCAANKEKQIDIMFAYNDPKERNRGILILGHWNDGVV